MPLLPDDDRSPRWVISNRTGLPTILRSLDAPVGQPRNHDRCLGCGRLLKEEFDPEEFDPPVTPDP